MKQAPKHFTRILRLIATALFLSASSLIAGSSNDKNVLIFFIDDLRPELGCYGVDYIKSPNMDKLGEAGIVFDRAYCQQALCGPSRISMMSGQYPNTTGIMDLWTREARLFKYGSGTGSNFSYIRGENEPLSGGGKSSGLMSFLKIGDRAAGAIKSGGTTRRAAKMVVVDIDHPDIEEYIEWKVKEEQKVAAIVTGSKVVSNHMTKIMSACVNCEGNEDDCFDPSINTALKREVKAAKKALVPENYIQRVIQLARQGYTDITFPVYNTDWDSEAYLTVAGQNSNNSVRVPNDFLNAVLENGDWELIRRTDGKVAEKINAGELWQKIAHAAWACADPGLQYDTTINEWHTCPSGGRINASNPCSEYMFLDDTACNLASLNLMQFRHADGRFDIEAFEPAVA